jgi:hypothetical protein|tara:strand:- start:737 stop:868 length:132 start_codon:yes stop_codon:yes gene_type:complete
MKKKEAKNLIYMIQLILGISIASACIIVILVLVFLFLGSKLGI